MEKYAAGNIVFTPNKQTKKVAKKLHPTGIVYSIDELLSLINSAKPIVEIFKAETKAQKKWKADWLKKANELTQNREA